MTMKYEKYILATLATIGLLYISLPLAIIVGAIMFSYAADI